MAVRMRLVGGFRAAIGLHQVRHIVSRLVVTLMMRPQRCASSVGNDGARHQERGDDVDLDDAAEFFRRRLPQFADRPAFAAQQARC